MTEFRYRCLDPCEILCEVPLPFEPSLRVDEYTYSPKISLNRDGMIVNEANTILVDASVGDTLLKLRERALQSIANRGLASHQSDPFYPIYDRSSKTGSKIDWIGRSVFVDRAGVELASIQAVYSVIPAVLEDEQTQSGLSFSYFSIGGGPGAWIEYIQRYYPLSHGAGISNIIKNDWNLIDTNIDVESFEPIYDNEDTGDIYQCWQWLTNYLPDAYQAFDLIFCQQTSQDVTLTIAVQAYVAMNNLLARSDVVIPASKQPASFEEIEQQSLSAITRGDETRKVLGGSLVITVDGDLTTQSAAKALYVIASCFEWITCFKPITSRPDEPIKYIICYNYAGKEASRDALEDLYLLASGENSESISIRDDWPKFTDWLRHINTEMSKKEIVSLERMTGTQQTEKKYDLSKLLLLLNLQGTTGYK